MNSSRTISLVKQTKNNNCAAACISMVTGESIEEVEMELQADGGKAPYGLDHIVRYFTRHGIYMEKIHSGLQTPILDDSIYIATCPSYTVAGESHMICLAVNHGSVQVLDPSDNLEEEKIFSLGVPVEGWIQCFEYFKLYDCTIKNS